MKPIIEELAKSQDEKILEKLKEIRVFVREKLVDLDLRISELGLERNEEIQVRFGVEEDEEVGVNAVALDRVKSGRPHSRRYDLLPSDEILRKM
jgi:hypothetical protein